MQVLTIFWALATLLPLSSGFHVIEQVSLAKLPPLDSNTTWTSPPPNLYSSHHPLIFQAASGLLQHWANTAFPGGHTLVPGIIPLGVALYHGTNTAVVPGMADWISFDPEHAILFGKGERAMLHTYVASRALKVIFLCCPF